MITIFWGASLVAVAATLMVITRRNAVSALLYLVVSLLAAAVAFFALGSPFAAALEIIVYAGAIMVLFIFVVMMFDFGPSARPKLRGPDWRIWAGPGFLALVLFGEFLAVLLRRGSRPFEPGALSPRSVGAALFGPYLLGVELAAMLLLAGVVGGFHLGRREKKSGHRFFEDEGAK
jgi:NADH-quinone oxidoreductase subunit J